MKRQLSFDFENEQYILKENGQIIFSIDAQELKFVSLDFYNGVYKGKSTAIELTNAIKDDKYKKGNYIFSCLNDIITSIQDEIHEPLTETLSNEAEPAKLSKAVFLYELSACAGDGFFMDGTPIKHPGEKFYCGVACYPEKHEEAPNLEQDLLHLKEKQDLGAGYAVTQLFYDNKKYFDFVAKARAMGITMPIIPGIKPLAKLTQVTQVPKTFHCDMPQELAKEAVKCTTDEEARQLGIEWAVSQCKELYANGVKDIHFYTVSAFKSMPDILRQIL